MSWVYRIDPRALRDIARLGMAEQRRVFHFLDERVAGKEDPRRFGKALRHELSGLWRYRVGDVRIICRIIDKEMLVLVVKVSQRSDAYR